MKQCAQCGTQNLDQEAACTSCGAVLALAKGGLGGTLLMDVPEPPPPPPVPAEAAKPAAAAKANLRGTMIGIAPPNMFKPAPPPSDESGPTSGNTPPSGTQLPVPPKKLGATMIGIAPMAYPSPPPPPPAASEAEATGSARRIASAQKTVMGVARPGIAPLNPGHAKAAAPNSVPPAPLAPPPPPAAPAPPAAYPAPSPPAAWPSTPAPGLGATAPLSPRRVEPNRISLTATLAIVAAAMLLVLAVMAFFMLRGHGSVTARPSLDESGNEFLDLSCSECPDGTTVGIDSSPVPFKAGKARLKLSAPLKVGENPIVLVLERPGRSREEIALALPIEFRVRGSTDELAQDSPKLSVLASVLPPTKLEVDGKEVKGQPSEIVRFDYDVSAELTGPEPSVKSLERTVPYKAESATGGTQNGQVQLRIGITPLIVDAPGASIVVGQKDVVIAGRTAPGSALKINAQSVQLDPEGRFVSKQSLAPGDNSFTVRSTLKDHAPRLVKVAVRRSDDLEREAARLRAAAASSYAELMRAPDASVGRSVWLDGQLFDARRDGYTSVLLVDVKSGCKKAPCLAKLLYGVETSFEKGRALKAFAKLLRFVDGPRTGERIPELRADLVVAGAK
jgi:hypothetical protein